MTGSLGLRIPTARELLSIFSTRVQRMRANDVESERSRSLLILRAYPLCDEA